MKDISLFWIWMALFSNFAFSSFEALHEQDNEDPASFNMKELKYRERYLFHESSDPNGICILLGNKFAKLDSIQIEKLFASGFFKYIKSKTMAFVDEKGFVTLKKFRKSNANYYSHIECNGGVQDPEKSKEFMDEIVLLFASKGYTIDYDLFSKIQIKKDLRELAKEFFETYANANYQALSNKVEKKTSNFHLIPSFNSVQFKLAIVTIKAGTRLILSDIANYNP